MVEFRVLGPVEVVADGESLKLGGPKQRALLAVLAIEVGRVVGSDRLMEALWGEDAADRAPQHLQTYVSNLRRILDPALGTRALVTRSPGYVLDVDPESVDLHRFAALADQARQLIPRRKDGRRARAVSGRGRVVAGRTDGRPGVRGGDGRHRPRTLR